MKRDVVRAEAKVYPEFIEDGIPMRVKCTGHTMDEKTDTPVYSHWQLWEYYGDEWRFVASTRLSGYANAEQARERLA